MPPESLLASLEAWITAAKGERSLLMAFCGDLAYFERVLLPHLQQEGEAAVTVLLDRSQYEACFADLAGISGTGLQYQLHPVRLPSVHAAFHPKLYCLCRPGVATLIVASANLTFYGARTNAEIVDRLVLEGEGKGDVAAFQSYLGLLELLPSLDETLPPSARRAIQAQADMIRSLLESGVPMSDVGPLLLHNAATPLLTQVAAHVPSPEIIRVTVYSPFFDPGSRAIKALAATYPKARLTIVKRAGRIDDLNGKALTSISKRLDVQEFKGIGERDRSLHAKIAVFESSRVSWVLAGSANLTSPAWLQATRDGGNLEAVTLRRFSSSKEARQLVKQVATTPVDWRTLTYAVTSENITENSQGACQILDAQLNGSSLELRCDARSWGPVMPVFRVTVEDHYGLETFSASCTKRSPKVADVHADLAISVVAARDGPAIVQLEVAHSATRRETGRAWLNRPDYLSLGAKDRALYRAKEALDQFRPTSSQWELLAEGWLRFVDVLRERWEPVHGMNATTAGTSSDDVTPRTATGNRLIRPDELRVDDSAIVVSPAGGRSSSFNLFQQLFASVQRLFLDDDKGVTLVSGSSGRTVVPDADESELEPETLSEQPESQAAPVLEGTAVGRVTGCLDALWESVDSAAVSPNRVKDVLGVLEHSVGSLLLPLYFQILQTQSSGGDSVIESMRRAWSSALSLHGLAQGQPHGWLVRAWAQAETTEIVDDLFSSADRAGRIIALLAIAAAPDLSSRPWSDADSITNGLLVLTRKVRSDAREALADSVHQATDRLAVRSQGRLSVEGLLSVLGETNAESLPIIKAARRWSPVAHLALADDGERDVTELERTLRAGDPGLWATYQNVRRRFRPAAVSAVPVRGGLSCGGCRTQLSTERAERLRRLDAGSVNCEACGRILLPFDFQSEVTRKVLEALAPDMHFTPDGNA